VQRAGGPANVASSTHSVMELNAQLPPLSGLKGT
jgi:hypothetical protein